MFALFAKKPPMKPAIQMNSSKGVVTGILSSNYETRIRVKYEATEWFAHSDQPLMLQPGDFVRVIGRLDATTLLIETEIAGSHFHN